ncbi:MAG: rhodanese-like domain-containing protein [Phycisphaerales bacterium]
MTLDDGTLPAGLPQGYPYRRDDETTPRELKALRSSGAEVLVLDVRTQPEWDICRIDGARLLPLQELDRRVDELKAELDDDLSRRIVVNCHHGRRSLTATYILRAAGFTNVTSLAGGIHLWSLDVDPKVPTY